MAPEVEALASAYLNLAAGDPSLALRLAAAGSSLRCRTPAGPRSSPPGAGLTRPRALGSAAWLARHTACKARDSLSRSSGRRARRCSRPERQLRRRCIRAKAVGAPQGEIDELARVLTGDPTWPVTPRSEVASGRQPPPPASRPQLKRAPTKRRGVARKQPHSLARMEASAPWQVEQLQDELAARAECKPGRTRRAGRGSSLQAAGLARPFRCYAVPFGPRCSANTFGQRNGPSALGSLEAVRNGLQSRSRRGSYSLLYRCVEWFGHRPAIRKDGRPDPALKVKVHRTGSGPNGETARGLNAR
jgi:hypothetical protein